jgi:hypothetical protein
MSITIVGKLQFNSRVKELRIALPLKRAFRKNAKGPGQSKAKTKAIFSSAKLLK